MLLCTTNANTRPCEKRQLFSPDFWGDFFVLSRTQPESFRVRGEVADTQGEWINEQKLI